MPMWVWIAVGVGSWIAFAVLLALALGRVFTAVARDPHVLDEIDAWVDWPTLREANAEEAAVERSEIAQPEEWRPLAVRGVWSGPGPP
jgi:hypothetical protein